MIKKAKKTTVVTKTKAKKSVRSVNNVKKPVGKASSVKKSIKKKPTSIVLVCRFFDVKRSK